MTSPEPMPGRTTAPFISEAADRMYQRLPRIYKILDVQNAWALKRYLAGSTSFAGDVDAMVERFRGSRGVGPSTPQPWDLDAEDLANWQAARRTVNSALTDPDLADAEWLPYIAQLLGAYLHPRASLTERRDTLRYATSGYKGGTKAALADAARSALTGSRYVLVQPYTRPDGQPPTVWDVTLRTRTSETPDQQAVYDTVIRKGAKPAGVRLWIGSFGTPWDIVEGKYPTWTDWESRTWDRIEEAGATYAVPDNLAPGPSLETSGDVANYSALVVNGSSTPTWALQAGAGIDGANAGRLTKVGATGGMGIRSAILTDSRILAGREFVWAVSVKPSAAVACSLVVEWFNSSSTAISTTTQTMGTLTAGEWNRSNLSSRHTSPSGGVRARISVQFTGTIAAGVTADIDALLFRIVSTTGG